MVTSDLNSEAVVNEGTRWRLFLAINGPSEKANIGPSTAVAIADQHAEMLFQVQLLSIWIADRTNGAVASRVLILFVSVQTAKYVSTTAIPSNPFERGSRTALNTRSLNDDGSF